MILLPTTLVFNEIQMLNGAKEWLKMLPDILKYCVSIFLFGASVLMAYMTYQMVKLDHSGKKLKTGIFSSLFEDSDNENLGTITYSAFAGIFITIALGAAYKLIS